jgi:hypothetical protein
LVAVIVSALLLSISTTSGAWSGSGWSFKGQFYAGPYGHVRGCTEAAVDLGFGNVYEYGIIGTFDTSGAFCDGTHTVGPDYIGVNVYGYRDNAFCGNSGWFYRPSAGYYYGLGFSLCTNPGGVNGFHSVNYGRIWNGSNAYHNLAAVTSPTEFH